MFQNKKISANMINGDWGTFLVDTQTRTYCSSGTGFSSTKDTRIKDT